MAPLTIDPNTDGAMSIKVTAAGTPVEDATVSAAIIAPSGKVVATAQPVPHTGSGIYELPIKPAWSVRNSRPVEGVFFAELTVSRGGKQRVHRVPYLVSFKSE